MSTAPAPQSHRVRDFFAARWFPLLLLLLAIVFVVQNRGDASVQLLWATLIAPLWLVLALLCLLGIGIGFGLSGRRQRARQD